MFQDPTAVAISGGTGIVGFRVDGPFPDGGPPPGYAPTILTDPVLVGYPMVGTSQSCTDSTASGNPTPTLTRQWMLDGVAITGETGADYNAPVVGDLGGLLSRQDTWTNAFGTVSAESQSWLVTPAMAAATSHKYIDPTLGADDGGPYVEGAAYTPTFPLGDGSTAPAGTIHSTSKAAYDASTAANGHRYYLRKGYFHDPVSGVFFTSQPTRSDTLFSSYGPADADDPVLDAVIYLDDATGWTPHGSVTGAWNYSLTGVTDGNSAVKGRLWVGRRNDGDLTSQRPVGTARRRAANSVNNVRLTNDGSDDYGLWYVTAGSPSVLTVMASVAESPPVYWDGIGLVFEDMTAGVTRGIVFRNGASNNRVERITFQGVKVQPVGISNINSNSVCDSNAFVGVTTRSFIGDGFSLDGVNASRTVEDTYVSGLAALLDSSVLECDSGTTNDFSNSNPIQLSGFTYRTHFNNITYEGHSVHTVFDLNNTGTTPPADVYVDGVSITFLPGANDGRAWGGFVDGGYFKNFTITGAPARSQWGGINFEVAYGVVSSTNTNKTPRDQYQAFKMVYTGNPTATPTANFSIHDVDFYMADTPNAKSAIWFESNPASFQSAANAVEVRDCRAFLADTQGFVVRAANLVDTTPWLDQNIHDNTVVNASLVGQNFSTANSGSSPPTYTTQPLNGFFGCSNNVVVAA